MWINKYGTNRVNVLLIMFNSLETVNVKKQLKIFVVVAMAAIISFGFSGCKKEEPVNRVTLEKLYTSYKDGIISECRYNGQVVYSAGINALDAGETVYDKDGKELGKCNYGWGNVDPICSQLTGCEVIYRVKDNIWGQPAVDKYGLGR